ncbi:MAG TPA: hypothetical protein GXX46_12120 [Peptococcaceae bacterium]|nr:hypothetical protein [Peptococcaceae bacterium]
MLESTGEIINTIIFTVIASGIIYWNPAKGRMLNERTLNGTDGQSRGHSSTDAVFSMVYPYRFCVHSYFYGATG